MSDLNPTSARNGAKTSGSAIIVATSQTGTPSSTIITRFSVPMSSTTAMPTETWNSDRRSSFASGSSSAPTSAKGSRLVPSFIQALAEPQDLFIGRGQATPTLRIRSAGDRSSAYEARVSLRLSRCTKAR